MANNLGGKLKFKDLSYHKKLVHTLNKSDIVNIYKPGKVNSVQRTKLSIKRANSRHFVTAGIHLPENISKLNNPLNLGSYLAGLIEGDGYISITKEDRVILGITFNIKDKPLAEKILHLIGKGYIVKRKGKSIELRFSAKKSIQKIIKLINGEFKTPKIDQLYNLIDWINKKHGLNLKKLPLNQELLENNNWLAGFIDADGSFYIRYSSKQIICKFSLEQRMIYPNTQESYLYILNNICQFLNVKLHVRNRETKKASYYIIRVENHNSINILINYLDNHILLSSKYLDYLEWKKAFLEIKLKNHFTDLGKNRILTAKNNMNDKRTYFNWDHLDIFKI